MKSRLICAGALFLSLLACQGTVDPDNTDGGPDDKKPVTDSTELAGTITLYASRSIIEADNEYESELTVLLMDKSGVEHDVTSEVEIYCEGSDTPITESSFRTSEAGEYNFYAMRGFDISNTVTVRAVKGVPALPEDPNVKNMGFHHRMLLLQHTGNECPNCPALMTTLKTLSEDEDYSPAYHHVASHSYNSSDAAYSSSAASLSKELDVHYYPWLTYNLSRDNGYYLDDIRNAIDGYHKEIADAAICASAALVGDDIYVNVGIKSRVDQKYRVAVWLLEDNIRSTQSGATASWQHTHDNCLRAMGGASKNEAIYGRSIGKVGARESYDFIASIDSVLPAWKIENCKIMVIAVSASGNYELVNCTVCPVGGSVTYEYK